MKWVVRGRVQGVGFRWFVHRQAQAHGVAGWARNLDDGSVEVVALGSPEAVAALERDVRHGPRGAHVTGLTAEQVPHEAVDTKSFTIKH